MITANSIAMGVVRLESEIKKIGFDKNNPLIKLMVKTAVDESNMELVAADLFMDRIGLIESMSTNIDFMMQSGFITDFDLSDENYKTYLCMPNTLKTPYTANDSELEG